MSYQVAIDGPAGAGKSTIAKLVSARMKFVYVDTGAMYRAIALGCLNEGVDLDNEDAVSECAEKSVVTITYENGEQVVMLNGENVNGKIRTQAVGDAASKVSVYKRVRSKLVLLQQELAKTTNVVMDGRDIASCVLPKAQVKIYLDADVTVRAKRRYDELIAKGLSADLQKTIEEVKERDYRDMNRENSPLVRVPEATYVDSSYLSIEEVTDISIKITEAVING